VPGLVLVERETRIGGPPFTGTFAFVHDDVDSRDRWHVAASFPNQERTLIVRHHLGIIKMLAQNEKLS
jgi:hypothetical protein